MAVSPNFHFLAQHDPLLERSAAFAERYVFEDPDTSVTKVRLLAEGLARLAATYLGIEESDQPNLQNTIQELWIKNIITPEIKNHWHVLRINGNAAAHGTKSFNQTEALFNLRQARTLAVWFHKSFGKDPNFKPGPFVPPTVPSDATAELSEELTALRNEMRLKLAELEETKQLAKDYELTTAKTYEDLQAALSLAEESEAALAREREQFESRLAETRLVTESQSEEEIDQLSVKVTKASQEFDISEADTRKIIDQQLRSAGWEADSEKFDFRKGARPQKGKFIAIAEWPTESGPADYVLFDGLTPLAVVEAKRRNKNVSSYLSTQATRYSKGFIFDGGALPHSASWGDHKIPFIFSANGRPYLAQLLEESGIWFRDTRRAINPSRALQSWYSPEGMKKLLAQDQDTADANLKSHQINLLPLRNYQQDAVVAVEHAIVSGQRSVLLAMATGTGKTRVCVNLIYRLLKAKKFRRALFLVDRTSLGVQALDENFKQIKLEGGRTFTEIYDVKELGDIKPDTDTKLQIATVQGMMKRLLYPSDGNTPPSVDTYDLIVIDECHRGYTLDKDLSDNELNFRSEDEYLSKYRRVVDYFDAVKVGVTATPALHTTEIFGAPVFNYTYRRAVIEDVLVDHLPPYRIKTRLGEDGINWQAGEDIEIYQPKTGQLNLFNTPDDVSIEIEEFNRSVITESFNKAVCSVLAKEIDPTAPGKTLVFCANERHAVIVRRLLLEAFREQYGDIEDEAVEKITGSQYTDNPLLLLRKFKNETYPSVAITVDYLTTGVDVEEITNLVFMRRVRSRILYEQMIGRATRKRDDLFGPGEHKDSFRIFDAVDIYSALEDVNSMRPVVANPNIRFAQLLEELGRVDVAEQIQDIYEQLVAKLNRRLKRISHEHEKDLRDVTDLSAYDLGAHVRSMTAQQAKDYFKEKASRIAKILDEKEKHDQVPLFVSHHVDAVLRVERNYGDFQRPEDYLMGFAEFLNANKNHIHALTVVTTRPSKLTRKDLRELKFALDREGFPEKTTETAYSATNQHCAASIIGYIRRATLGSPLVPYEQRLIRAMEKIYKAQQWSTPQLSWLKRFEKQLRSDKIIDQESLDSGLFKRDGGFPRINKIFDGKAEQLLEEIQDEIWKDVA
jgi:type I restriction enzyme R subunit